MNVISDDTNGRFNRFFWKSSSHIQRAILLFVTIFEFSCRSLLLRKAIWAGTLVFSGCLLILFPFAFGTEFVQKPGIRVGSLWMISEFVVALVTSRMFQTEAESGMLEALLASGANRSVLFLSKVCFTSCHLLSLLIPILFFWALFFNIRPEVFPQTFLWIFPIAVLFSIGTSAVGGLTTCLTARSLAREILAPLLFYPLQVGILLAAVTLTLALEPSLIVGSLDQTAWWALLIGYPAIFLGVGWLTGHHLFEE